MDRRVNWVERLGKWRSVFAGWQLGTRLKGDAESDAVRDHREATMMLRAEMNALTAILIREGVCTAEAFTEQVQEEARHLCTLYSEKFPGFTATDDGMSMNREAAQTMKGWPL